MKYVYALFDADHPLASKYFDEHCFAVIAHYQPWKDRNEVDVRIGDDGLAKIESIFQPDDPVYPDYDVIAESGCVPAYDNDSDWEDDSDWDELVAALDNDPDFVQDHSLLDAYFEALAEDPALHPEIVWSVTDFGSGEHDLSVGYARTWRVEKCQSDTWRLLDQSWVQSCVDKAVGEALYESAEGYYHNVANYEDVAEFLRQQEGWTEDTKFPTG